MKLICLFILLCHCCVTNKSSVWCANILKICQKYFENMSTMYQKYIKDILKIYPRERNKKRDSLTCGKKNYFGWKKWQKDAVHSLMRWKPMWHFQAAQFRSLGLFWVAINNLFLVDKMGKHCTVCCGGKPCGTFKPHRFLPLDTFFKPHWKCQSIPIFFATNGRVNPQRGTCADIQKSFWAADQRSHFALDLAGREKSLKSSDTDTILNTDIYTSSSV